MEILEEMTSQEYHSASDNQKSENISPFIEKIYKQLLSPKLRESEFLREIRIIVFDAQRFFIEEPNLFKTVWRRRKETLAHLDAAVRIATITHFELPLFVVCRSITSEKEDNIFADIPSWVIMPGFIKNLYSWNSFKEKIEQLLIRYLKEDLNINLIFSSEEDSRRRNHLRLVCDYLSIYEKLNNLVEGNHLGDELKLREECGPLVAESERVIKNLISEKKELEKEKEHISKTSQKQVSIMEIYLRQNQKLKNKLDELTMKFDKVLLEGKLKHDENKLLKIQLEKLMRENESLRKETNNENLVKANLELLAENERLKGQLSEVSSHLRSKSNQLNSLKIILNDASENLGGNYEEEIEKFIAAANKNDKNIKDFSQAIIRMIEKINQELKVLSTKKVAFF